MKKYKIYIGFDPREKLAYDVARHSILSNTQSKVQILPLELSSLPMLTRPIEQKDGRMWCPISNAFCATEFSISRFCVPFLTKGWALFMDCDMVCLSDIEKLFELRDDKYAVMVVKHKQESGSEIKMDNQIQSYYSKKNWSSMMLINASHPSNKKLTIEMVNSLPGRDLHAFCWLEDNEIGELSIAWNYLIGVSEGGDLGNGEGFKINLAHFTLGGPWIDNWRQSIGDNIWINSYNKLKICQ